MGKLVFGGDDAASPVSDDQFKVTARGVVHWPVCVLARRDAPSERSRGEREWRGKWKMTEKTAASPAATTAEVIFPFGDRERRKKTQLRPKI